MKYCTVFRFSEISIWTEQMNMHLFICLACLCRARSLKPTAIVPVDESGDKSVESELTKCWAVFATDVPRQNTEKMWWHFLKMCVCIFLNFDVNMICHEKKRKEKETLCSCASHGLNNRTHTYWMAASRTFSSFRLTVGWAQDIYEACRESVLKKETDRKLFSYINMILLGNIKRTAAHDILYVEVTHSSGALLGLFWVNDQVNGVIW